MIKQANVKGSGGNKDVGLVVIEGDTNTSVQSFQGDGRAIMNLFRTILPCGTLDVILLELLQDREENQAVWELKDALTTSILRHVENK